MTFFWGLFSLPTRERWVPLPRTRLRLLLGSNGVVQWSEAILKHWFYIASTPRCQRPELQGQVLSVKLSGRLWPTSGSRKSTWFYTLVLRSPTSVRSVVQDKVVHCKTKAKINGKWKWQAPNYVRIVTHKAPGHKNLLFAVKLELKWSIVLGDSSPQILVYMYIYIYYTYVHTYIRRSKFHPRSTLNCSSEPVWMMQSWQLLQHLSCHSPLVPPGEMMLKNGSWFVDGPRFGPYCKSRLENDQQTRKKMKKDLGCIQHWLCILVYDFAQQIAGLFRSIHATFLETATPTWQSPEIFTSSLLRLLLGRAMRPWKRTSKGPVLWRDAAALERRRRWA